MLPALKKDPLDAITHLNKASEHSLLGARLIEKYAENHLSQEELTEIRTKVLDKLNK